jgi:putative transposase
MRLVEQHIIKESDNRYKELAEHLHLSKNLYNAGLYAVRQHFFQTSEFLNYESLYRQFVDSKNVDYYALPTKVSQQTLKMVEQNFKSFFGLLKLKDGKARPKRIPKYLDKEGKFQLIYTVQAISKVELRKGFIKLSGTNVRIETTHRNIQQVRVIPKGNHICVEVIYQTQEPATKENNGRYASIDLGLNNLACLTSNAIKPIIINGKPLKSVNQFFNKRKAELQSKLKHNRKTSHRIKAITHKRNCKIKDYLHKTSRKIINHLVTNDIPTLVIGKNDGWKQEINIGSRNNQNFVNIPHSQLVQMLEYKAKMEGINVILQEESYTSKSSFLDNEPIQKHSNYSGKRITRGLFRTLTGKVINADANGSLNILRKAVPNIIFDNGIEVSSAPLVLTIK